MFCFLQAHQAAQTATYHRKVKAHWDEMEKGGKMGDVSEKDRKQFEKDTWRKEGKEPNFVLPAHLASALERPSLSVRHTALRAWLLLVKQLSKCLLLIHLLISLLLN